MTVAILPRFWVPATTRAFDAVVVGDLHIPSPVFRAELFLRFLERLPDAAATLVLNGDVFENSDPAGFADIHAEVVNALIALQDRMSVVWLLGNHDGSPELLRQRFGLRFRTRHLIDLGGVRRLVIHGDAFDPTVCNRRGLTALANRLYLLVQTACGPYQGVARRLKRWSKRWSRSTVAVRDGCRSAACESDAVEVIAGHTHIRERLALGDTQYINPGAWTDDDPGFVGIAGPCTHLLSADQWLRTNSPSSLVPCPS